MLKAGIKLAATAVAVILALCSCGKGASDDELIRAAINKAAEAAEAKDVAAFVKLVSKDYRDANGLDYNGIKGIVLGEFFKPGGIKVFVTGVTVDVKGERALATAKAALVRGRDARSITEALPENADAFKFELIFRKEGRDWRLINASWESVSAAGLI